MTIDIETVETSSHAWDDLVSRADAGTFFHQADVLEVVAEHSGSTLHRLIGYKGDQPMGLFPIFERSVGPVTMAFSPPPRQYIPGLGPLLIHPEQLKQSKRERRNTRFIEACLAWIADELSPRYVRIESVPGYGDPRPFAWEGFTVTPMHTYAVELSGSEDELLKRFSKSRRREITNTASAEYTIERGSDEDVKFVIEKVSERYEAQNRSYHVSPEYALDLRRAADGDQLPTYVGWVDGERISGIMAPRFNGTMYFWQGGGKPDTSVPINSLIHWQIMRDGLANGTDEYDLVGANTPRLCRYKTKFNPALRTYYAMERGTPLMSALAGLYRRVQ